MSNKAAAISVRKATPEDAPTIRDIKAACLKRQYSQVYTEKLVNKWISLLSTDHYIAKIKSSYWFYVATTVSEGKEKVVGYGFLNTNSRRPQPIPDKYNCTLQLELLYIDVAYQRCGIGGKLMQEIEKKALEEGCSRLGVLASLPGVPFYSKRGYCTVEESVSFDILKQTFTPGEYSIVTAVMCKDLQ